MEQGSQRSDRVRSIRVGEAVFEVQWPFRAGRAWAESYAVDESWLKGCRTSFDWMEAADGSDVTRVIEPISSRFLYQLLCSLLQ